MIKYFTLLLAALTFLSCKKEESASTVFTLSIHPINNGSQLSSGEEITAADGRKFSVQTFRFYLNGSNLFSLPRPSPLACVSGRGVGVRAEAHLIYGTKQHRYSARPLSLF